MKKILTFSLLTGVSIGILSAQKKLLPGLLISGSDSLQGVFLKQNQKSGQTVFLFRESGSQEFQTITPQIGRRITIGEKAHYTAAVQAGQIAFFETIVSSTYATLLKRGQEFFISVNDSVTALKKERLLVNGSQVVKKSYLGTLTREMAGCPDVFERINQVSLNEAELTELFIFYNGCRGGKNTVSKKTIPTGKTFVRLVGGWAITSFRGTLGREELFLGNAFRYFENRTVREAHGTFGFGLDVPIQRSNKKIYFSPELRFSAFTEHSILRSEELTFDVNSVTIRNSFLTLPILFSYLFSSRSESGPFVKAGLLTSYNLIAEYENLATRSVSPATPPRIGQSIRLQNLQYGFSLGAGYRIPIERLPLQFECRYEYYGPFNDDPQITLTKTGLMLLLNVSF